MGYLPDFLLAKDYAQSLVVANGVFEVLFGLALAFGVFTRIVAAVLSLHLFVIAFGFGYNDIFIRDIGLALATLSIALGGNDTWCLERKYKRQ